MNTENIISNSKIFTQIALKQKNIYYLLLITFACSFLELLSLSMAIPLVLVVIENDISKYTYLVQFFSFFDITTQGSRVYCSLLVFVAVFFGRSLFLIGAEYFKLNFLYKLNVSLNIKIHNILLSQPYNFFYKNNIGSLIQRNLTETSLLAGNLFTNILQILVDILFLIMAVILFILIEPVGSSIIFIFLLLMATIYFSLIKNSLGNWGKSRMLLQKETMQNLIENFSMIREIKFSDNKINFFILKFINTYKKLGKIGIKESIFYLLTKTIFELLTVVIFCIIIFYFFFYTQDVSYTLFILGIFSIAAFRIIPLLNRTLTGFQRLKFYLPSISNVNSSLNLFKSIEYFNHSNDRSKFILEKKIKFQNMSIEFNQKIILKNINIEILKNEIIGIYGESGSGKTTFIDILSGLQCPTNGSLLVDDQDIKNNLLDWRTNIAYVPQNILLMNASIEKNIAFSDRDDEINKSNLERAINESQLSKWINELPDKCKTIIDERGANISGGQKQRIGVARSLYQNKEILILDEPTSALDPETTSAFIDSISALKGKKTIIIVSHDEQSLGMCDRIFEIKNNSIYERKKI
jgi:ABC-type bacteriocin/lantibiotic exporter with double-glycine peptidase domain